MSDVRPESNIKEVPETFFSSDDYFVERQQIEQNLKLLRETMDQRQKALLFDIINDMDCITERRVEKSYACGFRNSAKILLEHCFPEF